MLWHVWMLPRAGHAKPLADQKFAEELAMLGLKNERGMGTRTRASQTSAAIQMRSLPTVNNQNDSGLPRATTQTCPICQYYYLL